MVKKTAVKKVETFDADEVQKRIVHSRVRLLLNHPFFGNLATRLIIKDASDWCPTAATDGKHLYFNKDFLGALDNEELDFVIAHEVLHCVYDHFVRRETRDGQYWNMAGDYVINKDLKEQGIGRMPKVGLYDPQYHDMYSEEIYDDLFKNKKEVKATLDMHIDQLIDEMKKQGKSGAGGSGDQKGKNGTGPSQLSKQEQKQITCKQRYKSRY